MIFIALGLLSCRIHPTTTTPSKSLVDLPTLDNTPLVLRSNPATTQIKTKTSIMSSTSTASAASATCTGNRWVLPVQDAACALPNSGNYSAVMDKCCSPAKVTKYDDDCGLYCLAQDQSVQDLLDCIKGNSASTVHGEVFCSGNMSATATAAVPSSTGKDKDGDKTGTATGTGAEASATGDENLGVAIKQPLSKGGLGVLVVLGFSALLGAF